MNYHLKKILIKTRRNIFSEIIGNNSSLLKGEGYDFMELKEYEYGEDVKKIDWVISAKFRKPYVKVFHAQKELNINIIPILNGSMYFGSKRFKQDLLTEICAILGYSCVKQSDPFSSFIANEELQLCTKKSKRNFSVDLMCDKIFNYPSLGQNLSYKNICNELLRKIRKKSIIFLIGDFLNIKDLDLRVLSRKHEIISIILRDPFEENPFELGNVNLVDPSTNKTFEGILDKSTILKYKKEIKNNDHLLYEHFQKCGIKFIKIYTNEDPLPKLLRLMK
ncbi:DUF58 domain-containing protein [Arcobacter arenosus]|jgi:uncharacterized protein (DUF58 family)|uniref:DUF58 domain-containing protein n=1 Tax=Arcobacter arenosus TaxID=2576037 RepID=A0A5R8Y5I8_9BACT|nr:DUF58 domain-containing protein [Arcobacter arenosus]TLP40933.1 DUF58 domain-containing protein [Arcobacter arenosus]